MKHAVLLCAALVAVLNALLLVPAIQEFAVPVTVAALVLAVVTAALALLAGKKSAPEAMPAPAPPPPTAAPPPAPAANQAEAEIIAFFAMLQEKGRFIDFLMEDITAYGDAQIAAASRVVHQGCRDVLREHFQVTPVVADTAEGSPVTVPAGYAPDEFRLLGKVSGEPPFRGTLVHKGWKTATVKLPRIIKSDESRLPAIAPAEVELK